MDLQELLDLIKIREYVRDNVSLPTIDRKTVSELNGILLLMDQRIIGILTGVEFKDYIGYKNVDEAKRNAAHITNIYSGIDNKNNMTHRNIRNTKLDK
jgi:hypothetical protein